MPDSKPAFNWINVNKGLCSFKDNPSEPTNHSLTIVSQFYQYHYAGAFAGGSKQENRNNFPGRRGSESNGVFTDYQPQYPDLQGYFNTDFTGAQAVFDTTRHLPDLTRHLYPACSGIEEIVEDFVEGFMASGCGRSGWDNSAIAGR
jgi:hypothetical protein